MSTPPAEQQPAYGEPIHGGWEIKMARDVTRSGLVNALGQLPVTLTNQPRLLQVRTRLSDPIAEIDFNDVGDDGHPITVGGIGSAPSQKMPLSDAAIAMGGERTLIFVSRPVLWVTKVLILTPTGLLRFQMPVASAPEHIREAAELAQGTPPRFTPLWRA